jgi:hypothetical protein
LRHGAVVIDSLFGNVTMLSQLQNSCVKCEEDGNILLTVTGINIWKEAVIKCKVRRRTGHEGPEDGYRYTVLFL